jgi:protein-S-isoprenylcysteine O-methyltransferase Ste14
MKKLILPTLSTFAIGAIILGILIFLPAWTLNYWQAWVFIVVFLVSVNAIGVYLSLKDPALLERRKKVGPAAEQNPIQKIIMAVSILSILGVMVFSAFDHRFGWSPTPGVVSLVGDALVALGLLINYFVFQQNSFGGSTVEKYEGQQVISTGLYGLVRHPMYMGVLVMIVGLPLALGSWLGLWILVLTVPGLILRILDEEKLLQKELPGYPEYLQKVRYRLVPYLW